MTAFAVRTSGSPANTVEFWSVARLPFEPRGEMVLARRALRESIRALDRGRRHFAAAYLSRDERVCDVENVLLYNVGADPFRGLGAATLAFQRLSGDPPPAAPGAAVLQPLHYHRYTVASEPAPTPTGKTELARWSDIDLPVGCSATAVWTAMRDGVVHRLAPAALASRLALTLQVDRPPDSLIFGALKGVIDGVVSAFHSMPSTSITPDLAFVLGLRTFKDREWAEGTLADETWDLLGQREVVSRYRGGHGLKWNPSDDRLVAVHISTKDAPKWRVSGRLAEIS